jgi:hypothetical protein
MGVGVQAGIEPAEMSARLGTTNGDAFYAEDRE